MKRWFILTATAIAVLGLALVVLVLVEPGTLARETIRIGGSTVVFRITETDGSVYASATERRLWSSGWRTTAIIGKSAEVSAAHPRIVLERGQVLLHVGTATVEFDLESRSFRPPNIAL